LCCLESCLPLFFSLLLELFLAVVSNYVNAVPSVLCIVVHALLALLLVEAPFLDHVIDVFFDFGFHF
jgi:hypothetical protein